MIDAPRGLLREGAFRESLFDGAHDSAHQVLGNRPYFPGLLAQEKGVVREQNKPEYTGEFKSSSSSHSLG